MSTEAGLCATIFLVPVPASAVLDRLSVLGNDLAPDRAVLGEDEADPGKMASHDLEAYCQAHLKAGFFLVSPRVTYSVESSVRSGYLSIRAETREPEAAERIFEGCLTWREEVLYACASTFEELYHRNLLMLTCGESTVEGLVGFEIKRHIPGIYWRTFISPELLAALTVDPCGLGCSDASDGCVIRAFADPGDWRAHADDLDARCESNMAVFSISRARASLPTSLNPLAAATLLHSLG